MPPIFANHLTVLFNQGVILTKSVMLSDFDRRILALVQANNQRTHAEIGAEIGLSTSSVRRRLAKLRDEGVIVADIAQLDADAHGVTLIVSVSFREESPETYDQFDQHMRAERPVKQCYHVAGEDDYMLVVHGPSLSWYEDWSKQVLMANSAIRRYSTTVVWSCKKFDTAIDV